MGLVVQSQSQNQNNRTAKRPDLIQGQNPQLPAKRPKLNESMEVRKEEEEDDDDDLVYCVICKENVIGHTFFTCPDKAKAYGMYCFICKSPCKRSDNEHINNQKEVLKDCLECGVLASHWEDECPYNNKESYATGVDVDPEIKALFY